MAPAAALVFAGKSVAAPAISFLVNKAFNYLNEYHKAEGMGEMKNRILLALPKIQEVFEVVNPERIKEQSRTLDAWLWQLRDAVEEAEDAVDEVEYYELKEKAKDRKVSDWGSSFTKKRHKVVKSVKKATIVGKIIKDLTHHGTLKRLRKAVKGLDKAAADVVDFVVLANHLKGHTTTQEEGFLQRGRETGSMLPESQVFGRDKELKLVVGWLTKKSDQPVSSNHVSVVSVVGHGGMGKTTLAQLVCQDDAVRNHFEKVIWVCVSASFDATTIIGKILDSAIWETPNAKTLDALQKILLEKVSSIKFLLVLDDVWDDKQRDQWSNLFAPLRKGKDGSKILLTTRMQSVANLAADSMRGQNEFLAVQSLNEGESVKLFNHHAFPSDSIEDYRVLQPIGEQIAMNVRGCPLVIKVAASHLRDNLTFQYWHYFLDQRLEHFEGSADDIMDVLKLSYYHLPTELQTCFRYCSIFPQGYEFDKNQLVEMWVSSGFIAQDAVGLGSSLLDIGEQYLAQLTRKSFFDLRLHEDFKGHVYEHYVMHDLLHELARCVSLGECARINDLSSLENVMGIVRHISFGNNFYNIPVEKIMEISHFGHLRTIIIQSRYNYVEYVNKDILNTLEELIVSSKSLRIFQSGLYHTSHFQGKLGMLKHLRFVRLETRQPESVRGIVKLYHLTTLHWKSMVTEPKHLRDVGNLDQLRYLTVAGSLPVSRLSSLQELNYQIQGAQSYTISALKDLKSLRTLVLKGLENVDSHEEAKDAKLNEKQRLKSLFLEWSQWSDTKMTDDELILDNLEPHTNLQELVISGFSGTRMPHWIAELSNKNLVKLEFKSCEYFEQLPGLDKLLALRNLELNDLPRLRSFGQTLNDSGDECTELFLPPRFRTLDLICCPRLGELPFVPPSLVRLNIEDVGLTKLPRIRNVHNGNSVSPQLLYINVKHCQSLTSLEGSLLEQKQYMRALLDVRITACVQLEHTFLPFEVPSHPGNIKISNCPKLRMPSNWNRPMEDPWLEDEDPWSRILSNREIRPWEDPAGAQAPAGSSIFSRFGPYFE